MARYTIGAGTVPISMLMKEMGEQGSMRVVAVGMDHQVVLEPDPSPRPERSLGANGGWAATAKAAARKKPETGKIDLIKYDCQPRHANPSVNAPCKFHTEVACGAGPFSDRPPLPPSLSGDFGQKWPPRSGVLSLEQAHSMPNRQRVAHLAEKWGQVQTLSLKAAA